MKLNLSRTTAGNSFLLFRDRSKLPAAIAQLSASLKHGLAGQKRCVIPGLDMNTRASVYDPALRPYPEPVPEVAYPGGMEVRTVKAHGYFRWNRKDIFLTEVLWGEPVGLMPIGDDLFNIYFADRTLVGFDAKRDKLVPLKNPDGPKDNDKSKK
jgi:hypothetical protein